MRELAPGRGQGFPPEGSAALYFAFKAPGSELACFLKEGIQSRYRPHLLIDLDPQTNATVTLTPFGPHPRSSRHSIHIGHALGSGFVQSIFSPPSRQPPFRCFPSVSRRDALQINFGIWPSGRFDAQFLAEHRFHLMAHADRLIGSVDFDIAPFHNPPSLYGVAEQHTVS